LQFRSYDIHIIVKENTFIIIANANPFLFEKSVVQYEWDLYKFRMCGISLSWCPEYWEKEKTGFFFILGNPGF
jgi:hypothetical protein